MQEIINFYYPRDVGVLGEIIFIKTPTSLGFDHLDHIYLTYCQENSFKFHFKAVKSISRGMQAGK